MYKQYKKIESSILKELRNLQISANAYMITGFRRKMFIVIEFNNKADLNLYKLSNQSYMIDHPYLDSKQANIHYRIK